MKVKLKNPWSDTKPQGALELRKDAWGCVMWLYAKVAREGRTAAFSRETYGCAGGAAGCQALGVCTYRESSRADPRAVIVLTDIMARRMTRKLLGKDKLTFSVPFELYCEMEKNVPGSFLESDGWRELSDG